MSVITDMIFITIIFASGVQITALGADGILYLKFCLLDPTAGTLKNRLSTCLLVMNLFQFLMRAHCDIHMKQTVCGSFLYVAGMSQHCSRIHLYKFRTPTDLYKKMWCLGFKAL